MNLARTTVGALALASFALLAAQATPPAKPTPPAKATPPGPGAPPAQGPAQGDTKRAVDNALTDAEKAAGWVLLFDGTNAGKSLRAFKKQEMPEAWKVEDGCLVLRGSGGDIITRDQWDNFEFQTDWNVAEGGNSGIMWHVTEDGTYPWETGPEMQILDDAKHVDGKNRLTSAGSCYALYAAPEGIVKPAGQWNTAKIRCVGTTVQLFLNGTKVVEFDSATDQYKDLLKKSKFATMPLFNTKAKGHVALQDHGDVVKFRNIKVRPLDAQGKPALKTS